MEKGMSYQQYINNPMGNKVAVMSHRKMYEDLYHDKWNKLSMREMGKIDYKVYNHKDTYYIHIKVPSEDMEGYYYDTVIKLEGSQDILYDSPVQFFSNDPSFCYTFAYAFKQHDMIIKDLEPKFTKEFMTVPAKEKNPDNTIGYVKSLYFAYIFMQEKGLFHVAKLKMESIPYSKAILRSNVKHTDDVLRERTKRGVKQDEDGDFNGKKKPQTNNLVHPEVKNGSMNTKRIGFMGSAKRANTVKRVNTKSKISKATKSKFR